MGDYAWTTINYDASGITDPMRNVAATGEQIAAILDALATVLEIIAPLLVMPENPLKAIINAIIDALIAFIEDILSNNAAVAVHTNISIEKDWTITAKAAKKDTTRSTGRAPNLEDGDIPFNGTGMAGFMQGLLASVASKRDPWAPANNPDANAGLFLAVYGAPSIEEFADLWPLMVKFWDWDDDTFNKYDPDFWKVQWPMKKHMGRLGSAFGSRWCASTGIAEQELGWAAVQDGIKNRLGPANPFEDQNLHQVLDSMPVWRSLPIAALLGPPLVELMEALRDLLNSLKFPSGDLLKRLVEKLARKVRELQAIIEKLSSIIELLAFVIDMMSQLNFIIIMPDPYVPFADFEGVEADPYLGNGGIVGCFTEALCADNLPDFGNKGVVLGIVGMIQVDDGLDNFSLLWSLLGGKADALKAMYASQLEGVSEAWQDVRDAEEATDWNMDEGGLNDPYGTPNDPPTADADGDGGVTHYTLGVEVTLDGSGSTDFSAPVDSTPREDTTADLQYRWHFVTRPSSSAMNDTSLSSATAIKPTFTPDACGDYDIELTATDADEVEIITIDGVPVLTNLGDTDTDTVTIVVHQLVVDADADNTVATTSWAVGERVSMNGFADDLGSQATLMTYVWTIVAVPTGSVVASSDIVDPDFADTAYFTPDVIGDYTLTLHVTAEYFGSVWTDTDSDSVTITVS